MQCRCQDGDFTQEGKDLGKNTPAGCKRATGCCQQDRWSRGWYRAALRGGPAASPRPEAAAQSRGSEGENPEQTGVKESSGENEPTKEQRGDGPELSFCYLPFYFLTGLFLGGSQISQPSLKTQRHHARCAGEQKPGLKCMEAGRQSIC